MELGIKPRACKASVLSLSCILISLLLLLLLLLFIINRHADNTLLTGFVFSL